MSAEKFVSLCFALGTQAQLNHIRPRTRSDAEHRALDDFYTGLVPLADKFAECYQGRFELLGEIPPTNKLSDDSIKMLTQARDWIEDFRTTVTASDLQNILDELIALINQTLFRLRHLK